MFKKSDKEKTLDLNKQEISTLIGEGFHITGEVKGASVIRIDGRVTGNVSVESGIILGESGIIEGDLYSRSAVVYGTVTGNIVSDQLEIKKSASVYGDIQTDNIEIEMGANFNGKLNMKKQQQLKQVELPKENQSKEQLQKVV